MIMCMVLCVWSEYQADGEGTAACHHSDCVWMLMKYIVWVNNKLQKLCIWCDTLHKWIIDVAEARPLTLWRFINQQVCSWASRMHLCLKNADALNMKTKQHIQQRFIYIYTSFLGAIRPNCHTQWDFWSISTDTIKLNSEHIHHANYWMMQWMQNLDVGILMN